MNDSQNLELLEIYKLHAELADRVSQRREGANRLFVSLLVGMVMLLGVFVRFGSNEISLPIILLFTGTTGVVLSASWCIVIRSYRQLNDGKFRFLRELEKELSFPFFEKEWGYLGSRYWRLTIVETTLPFIFFIISLVIATVGVIATIGLFSPT